MSCCRWLTFFFDAKNSEETQPLLSKSVREVPKNPRATQIERLKKLSTELQLAIDKIKAEKKDNVDFFQDFEKQLRRVISQETHFYPIHLKCQAPCRYSVSESGDYKEKNGLLLAEKLQHKLNAVEKNISELGRVPWTKYA